MAELENPFVEATRRAGAEAQNELFETRRRYFASWINALAAAAREMLAEKGIDGQHMEISSGPTIENPELTDFLEQHASFSELPLHAITFLESAQPIRLEAVLAPTPENSLEIVARLSAGTREIETSRLSEQNKFDEAFKILVEEQFYAAVQQIIDHTPSAKKPSPDESPQARVPEPQAPESVPDALAAG